MTKYIIVMLPNTGKVQIERTYNSLPEAEEGLSKLPQDFVKLLKCKIITINFNQAITQAKLQTIVQAKL